MSSSSTKDDNKTQPESTEIVDQKMRDIKRYRRYSGNVIQAACLAVTVYLFVTFTETLIKYFFIEGYRYPYSYPFLIMILYTVLLLQYAFSFARPKKYRAFRALAERFDFRSSNVPWMFIVRTHIRMWTLSCMCFSIYKMEEYYGVKNGLHRNVNIAVASYWLLGFVNYLMNRQKKQHSPSGIFRWVSFMPFIFLEGYIVYLFCSSEEQLIIVLRKKWGLYAFSIVLSAMIFIEDLTPPLKTSRKPITSSSQQNGKPSTSIPEQNDLGPQPCNQSKQNENMSKSDTIKIEQNGADPQLGSQVEKNENMSKPGASKAKPGASKAKPGTSKVKRGASKAKPEQKSLLLENDDKKVLNHMYEVFMAMLFVCLSSSMPLPACTERLASSLWFYTTFSPILTIILWYIALKKVLNHVFELKPDFFMQLSCVTYLHFARDEFIDTYDPPILVITSILFFVCSTWVFCKLIGCAKQCIAAIKENLADLRNEKSNIEKGGKSNQENDKSASAMGRSKTVQEDLCVSTGTKISVVKDKPQQESRIIIESCESNALKKDSPKHNTTNSKTCQNDSGLRMAIDHVVDPDVKNTVSKSDFEISVDEYVPTESDNLLNENLESNDNEEENCFVIVEDFDCSSDGKVNGK